MQNKVTISFSFYILLVLLILFLPVQWITAAILAAFIHEAFHILAVLAFGGDVFSICVAAAGARIDAAAMSAEKTALSALAGPLGSFFCILLSECLPEIALCGLIQGAYNLLPIYPLDGGRALRCVCSEAVSTGLECFALVFLTGLSLWLAVWNSELGCMLLFSVWYPVIQRKFSCKEGKLAVQ